MAAEAEWVILDTSALVAHFSSEPGCEVVAKYRHRLAIPFVTLTEFVYLIWKRQGEEEAVSRYTLVKKWDRPLLWPDEPVLLTASRLKARYALGLADSYIAAFAKIHQAPLLAKDLDYQRLKEEISIIPLH